MEWLLGFGSITGALATMTLSIMYAIERGRHADARIATIKADAARIVAEGSRDTAREQVARDAKTIARMIDEIKRLEGEYQELATYLPSAGRDAIARRLDRVLSAADNGGQGSGSATVSGEIVAGAVDPA